MKSSYVIATFMAVCVLNVSSTVDPTLRGSRQLGVSDDIAAWVANVIVSDVNLRSTPPPATEVIAQANEKLKKVVEEVSFSTET